MRKGGEGKTTLLPCNSETVRAIIVRSRFYERRGELSGGNSERCLKWGGGQYGGQGIYSKTLK